MRRVWGEVNHLYLCRVGRDSHRSITLVRPDHRNGMRGRTCARQIGRVAIVGGGGGWTGAVQKQAVEDEVAVLDPILQMLQTGSGIDIVLNRYGCSRHMLAG